MYFNKLETKVTETETPAHQRRSWKQQYSTHRWIPGEKNRTIILGHVAQSYFEFWTRTQPNLEIRAAGKANTYRLL